MVGSRWAQIVTKCRYTRALAWLQNNVQSRGRSGVRVRKTLFFSRGVYKSTRVLTSMRRHHIFRCGGWFDRKKLSRELGPRSIGRTSKDSVGWFTFFSMVLYDPSFRYRPGEPSIVRFLDFLVCTTILFVIALPRLFVCIFFRFWSLLVRYALALMP